MNVTLGVFVEPNEARIVLVDADPPNAAVDQSEIQLSAAAPDMLVTTLLATARALADSGHRLVGTSLCASDVDEIYPLRNSLIEAGLPDVSVVSEPDAVTAAVRALSGDQTVATLVNDGKTVALSMVAAGVTTPVAVEAIDGDPQAAYRTLVQRFAANPGPATGLIVMGSLGDAGLPADVVETSPVPLRFPDDSEFILARGAALASFAQDATTSSPVLDAGYEPPTTATPFDRADTMQGRQLAYSEVPDDDPLGLSSAGAVGYDEFPDEFPDEFDGEPGADLDAEAEDAVRRRQWLIGSSVGALTAVGFATLAVSVAITVQPTTSQQAIRLQEEPVPGKAFPVAPGQGVAPDGPNWTMIEKLPPPDSPVEVRTFETRALSSTRDVANAAAPAIVNVYRDGTVGLQSAAAPLLPVGPAPTAPHPLPNVGPVFPRLSDYATRLIPDFSRIRPVDLLYFVANLRELVPFNTAAPSLIPGFHLNDLGVVAAVPRGQGALFSADVATAGPQVIPPALFDPKTSVTDKDEILPPGTRVIDLPTDTDRESPADALSDAQVEPGTEPGTAPGVAPDETGPAKTEPDQTGPEQTEPDQTRSDEQEPDEKGSDQTRSDQKRSEETEPDKPETTSDLEPDSDTTAPSTVTNPTSEPTTKTQAPQTPEPAVETQAPQTPEPTVQTQAPQTPEPTMQSQAPISQDPETRPARTPAPEPTVTAEADVATPTQAPVQSAPPATQQPPAAPEPAAPQAPAPTQEPAVTQAPAPAPAPAATQAPAPAPTQQPAATQAPAVQQAPQAPQTVAPQRKAPKTEAPQTKAPQRGAPVTTLPQSPFGGGSDGGGNRR